MTVHAQLLTPRSGRWPIRHELLMALRGMLGFATKQALLQITNPRLRDL